MQSISMEMNLSETAFVCKTDEDTFSIRYFTPYQEVPLCGHATLASAHILYEKGVVEAGRKVILNAQAGELSALKEKDYIKMRLPTYRVYKQPLSRELNEIIGVPLSDIYGSENDWTIAFAETEQEIRAASPNFEGISRHLPNQTIAITAKSSSQNFDFVVRVFCDPKCGIYEDPVTGSANCYLVSVFKVYLYPSLRAFSRKSTCGTSIAKQSFNYE